MSDDNVDVRVFEIDGVPMKIMTGISNDRRRYELCIECGELLNPIYVAKALELIGSNMLRGVHIPPAIYAKEMI